uniref:Uncharacterized protein n=1 Tax=Ixodes ricinus TaxID=34613 RepID=V5HH40_IXORI
MLLILDDDHKQHPQFIRDVDVAVAREFCKIANEFLLRGVNPKVYHSAAQKLQSRRRRRAERRGRHLAPPQPGRPKFKLSEQQFSGIASAAQPPRARVPRLGRLSRREREGTSETSEQEGPSVLELLGSRVGDWKPRWLGAALQVPHRPGPWSTFRLKLQKEGRGEPRKSSSRPILRNLIHMTELLEEALQSVKIAAYATRLSNTSK